MFYRIIKTFLGDAWRPEEVCFMHDAPKHPEVHRRFFGTRVRFAWDYDGIVRRAADLEKAIPRSALPFASAYALSSYKVNEQLLRGYQPMCCAEPLARDALLADVAFSERFNVAILIAGLPWASRAQCPCYGLTSTVTVSVPIGWFVQS
jgi:hypothetical protein